MKLNITDTPAPQDEEFVIQSLLQHNKQFQEGDIHPLFLTFTNDNNEIIAGLVASTWWGALEIKFLWVGEPYRHAGLGRQMMQQAEAEAQKRGCHMAYVDTFSFQAKGFYEKLGYQEYGHLAGYAHRFTRHYLRKEFQ
ncbi:GNAT family N-acetyltransferase [Lonsdalea quercina]|uniref:Acetyltransferase (GNAT) family protein n=1 Tax=Lonsdalea quercina TaxID=71657 RepID=A0A1H4D559_9GAMM|nr:GNAT family N-acetyltransferase [Lonsdalea quercina]SEA67854.1 Acetyltransferase (GNAT) family protein [Lonsdalea quercina]